MQGGKQKKIYKENIMKYTAHYQGKKISLLSNDLTLSENGNFGIKFLTDDIIFMAFLKNSRAKVFEHVWCHDFFGDNDLMMEMTFEPRKTGTIHYRYEDGWKEISRCSGYKKVSDTVAILTIGEMKYLCDIPSEKSLTVACDKIEIEEYQGHPVFLMKHRLIDQAPLSRIYYLEYYVDENGKVISKRFNTFRREFLSFREEELYSNLELLRQDCEEALNNEKEKLKGSILIRKK